jgi:hypothetical protein
LIPLSRFGGMLSIGLLGLPPFWPERQTVPGRVAAMMLHEMRKAVTMYSMSPILCLILIGLTYSRSKPCLPEVAGV